MSFGISAIETYFAQRALRNIVLYASLNEELYESLPTTLALDEVFRPPRAALLFRAEVRMRSRAVA